MLREKSYKILTLSISYYCWNSPDLKMVIDVEKGNGECFEKLCTWVYANLNEKYDHLEFEARVKLAKSVIYQAIDYALNMEAKANAGTDCEIRVA